MSSKNTAVGVGVDLTIYLDKCLRPNHEKHPPENNSTSAELKWENNAFKQEAFSKKYLDPDPIIQTSKVER